LKPEEKAAIDGLVHGLVDSLLPDLEPAARMAEDWRRTLAGGGPDLRIRLLSILAGAAALGQVRVVKLLADAARSAGASPEDVADTLRFLVPYCGWAVALYALPALKDEGGLDDPLAGLDREALRALGHKTARAVNPQFERVAEKLAAQDPRLLDHLTETAYGAVYGRPGLDLKTRELMAVALLAVTRHEPQLKYHVKGALNVGASADEVREILLLMHLVAGWPATLAGLEAMDAVVSRKVGDS
jgi:4-carboxymuconolactone decarboxylase